MYRFCYFCLVLLRIVASLFETFCLAAHEMHQAGLPLVIVERPVFSAFFESHVFRWKANDAETFINALEAAITDDKMVKKKSLSTRIQYSDAVFPYEKVLSRKPLFKHIRTEAPLTRSVCQAHESLLHALDAKYLTEILKK